MTAEQHEHIGVPPIAQTSEPLVALETLTNPKPDYLLIEDIHGASDTPVGIQGTITSVRRQGSVAFIDLRGASPDRKLQVVVPTPPGEEREYYKSLGLKKGAVVRLNGVVAGRPEEAVRAGDVETNDLASYEMQAVAAGITVVARPERDASGVKWQDLRKPKGATPVTPDNYGEILRMPEYQHVIALREGMKAAFMEHFTQRGYQSITVPGLTGSISESGAEVFKVGTDDGYLSLIQSPQQIKQIMAATEGRVAWTGQAYRNDPSHTRHHLVEFTGMDAEMQIPYDNKADGMRHLMYELQEAVRSMVERMHAYPQAFKENGTTIPTIPEGGIPVIRYADAMRITGAETFNREAERAVGTIVQAQTGSDFVFVTRYPDADKPFYTDPVADGTGDSYSFDLLYRGVEISSGGLRINDPALLRQRLNEKGFNPDNFTDYLDNFARGSAQTGGFGVGLERFVAQTLDLPVKLATVFPKTSDIKIG